MAYLSPAHRHTHTLRQRIGCHLVPNWYKCLHSAIHTGSRVRGHTNHSVPGLDLRPAVHKVNSALQLLRQSIWQLTADADSTACYSVRHKQGFSLHDTALPFNHQLARTFTSGGARKVIDEQKKDEKKEKEPEPQPSDTHFDRSLKSRKAKNTEHQSVIAHMSDVRTPRSLLKSSEKLKWEVSPFTLPDTEGVWETI